MGVISPKTLCTTFTACLLVFLLMESCSPTPRAPEGILDTPAHHVTSGFKFLQKDYDADAQREFELALQLDPFCSAAHRGLGLVYGKEKEFESALDSMRKARDNANTGEQKAMAYVGFMRLYTMREKTGWLEQTEERFKDALQWDNNLPDAFFYMGIAYKKAKRYPEAEKSFNQVLNINQGLEIDTRKELASLHNRIK